MTRGGKGRTEDIAQQAGYVLKDVLARRRGGIVPLMPPTQEVGRGGELRKGADGFMDASRIGETPRELGPLTKKDGGDGRI